MSNVERDGLRGRGGQKRRRRYAVECRIMTEMPDILAVSPLRGSRRRGRNRRRRGARAGRRRFRRRPRIHRPYLEIVSEAVAEPAHGVRGGRRPASGHRRPGTVAPRARKLATVLPARYRRVRRIRPRENRAQVPSRRRKSRRTGRPRLHHRGHVHLPRRKIARARMSRRLHPDA